MAVADVFSGQALWGVDNCDIREWAAALPSDSIHSIITSPPYWGLRDYGHEGQLGLEATPEEYVANQVAVFSELRRALHPSGSLWLNLGDSYAGSWGAQSRPDTSDINELSSTLGGSSVLSHRQIAAHPREAGTGSLKNTPGLKPKDLVGIPWRVAFALQADGWYLRQWCPWIKRNSMPESVTDRPGTACEVVFLLAKNERYYFDMEAVKKTDNGRPSGNGFKRPEQISRNGRGQDEEWEPGSTRNMRSGDFWFDSVGCLLNDEGDLLGFDVPVKGSKMAHFAVMPKRLVEPCVLAGTSERGVCPACGEPWIRVIEKSRKPTRPGTDSKVNRASAHEDSPYEGHSGSVVGNRDPQRHCTVTETVGWNAGCDCGAGDPVPAIICDPYMGSGTVAAVARENNRRAVGCELNPAYMKLIERRMGTVIPSLF